MDVLNAQPILVPEQPSPLANAWVLCLIPVQFSVQIEAAVLAQDSLVEQPHPKFLANLQSNLRVPQTVLAT